MHKNYNLICSWLDYVPILSVFRVFFSRLRSFSHLFFYLAFQNGKQYLKNWPYWDFPGGPVAKTLCPSAGGLGSIPGQGIRSHTIWLGVHMPQLKALACCNWRSCMPQQRPGWPNKSLFIFFRKRMICLKKLVIFRVSATCKLIIFREWSQPCCITAHPTACHRISQDLLGLL